MTNKYTQYYFIGIGGAGMSALARYFNAKGFKVAGYDLRSSVLTQELEDEGVVINYIDNISTIPQTFLTPRNTLVVFTPAIPASHEQLNYFIEKGFDTIKRAELLGKITDNNKAICIAGTHGKTTTTTITAHLFQQSQVKCNAFLGGISNNYKTNMILSNHSNYVIVEADEYDRSFHHLRPFMAVITSVDPDHLDIYHTLDEYVKSFEHFTSLIKSGGYLLVNEKVELNAVLNKGVKSYTYGFGENADFRAENIRIDKGSILFDFVTPTESAHDIRLSVPMLINVENGLAAMAMAWLNGVTLPELRVSMASFSGIYRRFDFKINYNNLVYIDDYAHHPSELDASIDSIRYLYPDRKITGIFQPHLYSRTKDFAKEFAQSLSNLDSLILLDIYPAREEPIEGVSSEIIFNDVSIEDKTLSSKENLLTLLDQQDLDIVVSFGAGDIEKIVPNIQEFLKKKYKAKNE